MYLPISKRPFCMIILDIMILLTLFHKNEDVWSIDNEDANFKLIKTTFNQKIKPRNTDIIVDDGFFC